MKTCPCCKTSISSEAWFSLPPVGLQDLDDGAAAELRNCTCGSTIGVALPALAPSLLVDLVALFATEAAHAEDAADATFLAAQASSLSEATSFALAVAATVPPSRAA